MCVRTEKRLCADTAGKWPSASQGEGLRRNHTSCHLELGLSTSGSLQKHVSVVQVYVVSAVLWHFVMAHLAN